jgi:hypothetical protein
VQLLLLGSLSLLLLLLVRVLLGSAVPAMPPLLLLVPLLATW